MEEPDVPTVSESFELLENERRRRAVAYLSDESETTSVETLAERIAESEHGSVDTPVADEHVREVEIGLHHIHLPKLADAGVVAYDRETGTVELVEAAALDAMLGRLERAEREWETDDTD